MKKIIKKNIIKDLYGVVQKFHKENKIIIRVKNDY